MIPPTAIAMGAGIIVLALEGMNSRALLLLALLAPFFYLGAEILSRRVILDEQGITIKKFLRSVSIQWSEVKSLDAVVSARKVFLVLEVGGGRPALITNTLQPFDDLFERLLDRIPSKAVSDSARELRGRLPSKHGPLIQAWAACIVLTALVIGKILGYA
jgi:hypothetical protein